jgi:hypothetical protein
VKKHFQSIASTDLEPVLSAIFRQYLAGNLSRPQELPFVQDDQLEIGITHYESETREAPHWHHVQREYQYMLAGSTIYTEIPSGIIHNYSKGDFYTIFPGGCYGQVSAPGTRILFIKRPAVNDKVTCSGCPQESCSFREQPFSGQAKANPLTSNAPDV